MQGLFITIEGPDGAGKTTVIEEIYPKLVAASKVPMIKTREPGGVKIAEKIRQIILDPKNDEMDDRTEALLYAAARRQHLVEKVFPALEAKNIVLCDRFVDSSIAYQGAGRQVGVAEIAAVNAFATENTKPDFTVYLDVDSDTGLKRIQATRRHQMDRLDNEGLEFHQRVRHEYLILAEKNPNRICKINASLSLSEVVSQTYEVIVKRYPEYFSN